MRSLLFALLAALLALAALLWWLAQGRDASVGARAGPTSDLAAPAAGDLGVPAEHVGDVESRASTRAELRTDAQAPGGAPESERGTLIVAITFEEDGTPAPGIEVALWPGTPRSDPALALARAETGADGRARFEGLAPGEIEVNTRRTRLESARIEAGRETELALVIPSGVDVDGLVQDERGDPVAGAQILVSETVVTRSDDAGRFFLRDLGDSARVAARERRHAPSPAQPVSGPEGSRVSMTLVLEGPGATLVGRVVDPDGHGIPRARVSVESTETYVRLTDGRFAGEPPPFRTSADGAGRFEIEGLPPGKVFVTAQAAGFANAGRGTALDAAEKKELEVRMRREGRVVGLVLDAGGNPVAKAWVHGQVDFVDWTAANTTTGPDGSFALVGLAPGEQHLRAGHREKGAAEARLLVEEGRETRWEAHLVAGGSLGGTVVDERDAPLAGFHVAAVRRGEEGLWLREDYADVAGRFHIDNCPEGEFVLAVRSPSETFGKPVALFDDFVLGQEDLVLRIGDHDLPTAFAVGTVDVPAGVRRDQVEISHGANVVYPDAETGVFHVGPLRPGEYELRLDGPNLGTLRLPPIVLAAGETCDLGRIEMRPAGWIVVRPKWPEGAADEQLPCVLLDAAGEQVDFIDASREGGTSGPLVQGGYVLRSGGWSWAAEDALVQVHEGERSAVELELHPATSRSLSFPLPPGAAARGIHVRVLRADGVALVDWNAEWRASERADAFTTALGGLLAGDYTVQAETDTGLSAAGSFTVADLAPLTEPLVFPLR